MHQKLLQLMKNENLTASRLAELLGIQSSSISHILSQRNKPSFDFIQKILRRFPNINPDWLLLDGQQMYRTETSTNGEASGNTPQNNLIDSGNHALSAEPADSSATNTTSTPEVQNSANTQAEIMQNFAGGTKRGVKRVILLYEDRSFESYELK